MKEDLRAFLVGATIAIGSLFVVGAITVQLANGYHQYLPTARSVAGGAYGAVPESTVFGPEGGRELVERTLEVINSFWAEK